MSHFASQYSRIILPAILLVMQYGCAAETPVPPATAESAPEDTAPQPRVTVVELLVQADSVATSEGVEFGADTLEQEIAEYLSEHPERKDGQLLVELRCVGDAAFSYVDRVRRIVADQPNVTARLVLTGPGAAATSASAPLELTQAELVRPTFDQVQQSNTVVVWIDEFGGRRVVTEDWEKEAGVDKELTAFLVSARKSSGSTANYDTAVMKVASSVKFDVVARCHFIIRDAGFAAIRFFIVEPDE